MALIRQPDEWDWWEGEGCYSGWRATTYIPTTGNNTRARRTSQQQRSHTDYVRDGEELMAQKGVTPLEFLQSVMEGEEVPSMSQMQAATAILPYKHRKQPVAVESSGPDGKPIEQRWNVNLRFVKPSASGD